MDTEQLRQNFNDQLANAEKQIVDLEASLLKAKEYKLKLQGGLETLDLLNPPEEPSPSEETPTE